MLSKSLPTSDTSDVFDVSDSAEVLEDSFLQRPMISIVIPVYNQECYLKDTYTCLMNQTFTDWEAIWVNDASTDRSAEILNSFSDTRMRVIHLAQNVGVARCRNTGTAVATGRYLAFLDSDDLWLPQKLEHQLSFMKSNHCAFYFTDYEFANHEGKGSGKVTSIPKQMTYWQALGNTTIFTSTVMLDRQQIPDELMQMPTIKSEDTATWWNILRAGYVGFGLQENLTLYRRPPRKKGGKSMSSNKVAALKRIWVLYRKHEHLSVAKSIQCFVRYAVHAVMRRI